MENYTHGTNLSTTSVDGWSAVTCLQIVVCNNNNNNKKKQQNFISQ